MPGPTRKPHPAGRNSVRVDGRFHPVIDRVRLAGRVWPVLERLRVGDRQQLKVFDRFAGPRGGFRVLHRLPANGVSWQHLEVLRRLSTISSQLPTILECRREGEFVNLLVSWLDGSTLREYLDAVKAGRRPPTSPTEAIRLIRGLAHAVSQLHRHRQVIHGDLRPENLLLTSRPSRLVMIDFGSAWMAEATAYRQAGDGFVPAYTAPELQSPDGANRRDHRCDQFSTGVMLFELLTGTLPYDGLGGEVLKLGGDSTSASRWTPPGELLLDNRPIPRRLKSAINNHARRELLIDPENRFTTSAAWLDSLDSLHFWNDHTRKSVQQISSLTGVISWLRSWPAVFGLAGFRIRGRRNE